MIEKNANTWFPGDQVKVIAKDKTASLRVGEILDVDPAMELAHVKFPDGAAWIGLDELERA